MVAVKILLTGCAFGESRKINKNEVNAFMSNGFWVFGFYESENRFLSFLKGDVRQECYTF